MEKIKFHVVGDAAIMVTFGKEILQETNLRVHAFTKRVRNAAIPGICEVVPTYCSVLISYDPCAITYDQLKKILKSYRKQDQHILTQEKRIIEIPVCYDDCFALDMKDVMDHTKLSKEEIIRIHSGTDYLIYMLGFLPGFAYLGGMDKAIQVPRLETPRKQIPAGSVGIGGSQTGIYPLESPGGWRLIGKTPLRPYNHKAKQPFLYQAGDYLRFVPISLSEYEELERKYAID